MMRALYVLLVAGLVCGAAAQAAKQPTKVKEADKKHFSEDIGDGLVRVGGLATHGDNEQSFQQYFADKNCREFRFSGWNSWEIVEAAYGEPSALPKKDRNEKNGKDLVHYVFDSVQDAGIKVGRFFSHGHNRKKMTLLTAPGKYNEKAMKALDWVLAEAGKRNLKLILTFADNWKDGDSRTFWTRDFNGAEPMDFYSDKKIIQQYKDHISVITNRKNTVNGIIYKNDPTIFSWNLMNEPRCDCQIQFGGPFCELSCAETINNWVGEMSAHLKSQDPNHMVVVGEEGFYSLSPWKHWVNPDAFFSGGAPWSQRAGQDFVENHRHRSIDYLSVHSWPDNWGLPELWFQDTWVREHSNDAWWMKKPFVVEEFGKIVIEDDDIDRKSIRDPFITAMYKQFNSIRGGGGPLKGVAFWEFDAANHTKPGPYGIRPTHSTWQIIKDMSWWVRQEIDTIPVLKNCVPGKDRSMDAVFLKEEIYYTTAGTSLLSLKPGKALGKAVNETSVNACIALCEKEAACKSFRYNEGLELGTCDLQEASSSEWSFNNGGWQTYWKMTAGGQCKVKNCELCDGKGVCIKCTMNAAKKKRYTKAWDKKKKTVVCN